jgi:hypothetical protein
MMVSFDCSKVGKLKEISRLYQCAIHIAGCSCVVAWLSTELAFQACVAVNGT